MNLTSEHEKINGADYRKLIIIAAQCIEDNKEEINRKRRERYASKKLERSLADGNSRIEE